MVKGKEVDLKLLGEELCRVTWRLGLSWRSARKLAEDRPIWKKSRPLTLSRPGFFELVHIESYANLYHTTFALFEMMLGRFFAKDMLDSNPLIGQIFFSSFMICIFILLMNFLITIVCEAISSDVYATHDKELGEYIWRSFRAMLGFHSTPMAYGYIFVIPGPRLRSIRVFRPV
ncbi:hypothetical protein Bbelb_155170 [Branchiostoma belcheri]|nr:hypothetical protein Bbelb_155170 [Branchiostoma belcheri]